MIMIVFQVTPVELIDIEFIKPKHSKNPEHQDNTSVLPAKRMKVTGGPQNRPKIKAETLHNIAYMSWWHNLIAYARKK